ncbi:MAG TPA: hypothetical protein VEQ10_08980 [Vicinamibacteria bacterium]|nr:hypothetical protein [Vicinamibacteria bacterium]
MRSDAGSERLDLDRLVTSEEDVRALRRAREAEPMPTARLLQALAALPPPSAVAMRRRRGPAGPEPFRLVE